MLLQGSLRVTTLPEILHSICISHETGILTLQLFNVKKRILFEAGSIVFAYSNQKRDTLGEVLFRKGTISLEQYLETAKLIRPGLRHGQILLQNGLINTQQLIEAVHRQIKEIIFSVFSWSEGTFNFERFEGSKETIKLNISSTALIIEGVLLINDWSVIQKVIGPLETILDASPEYEIKMMEIELSDREMDILNYAQNQTVREVLHYSLLSNYETARLLAAFVTADLLRIRKSQHFSLEAVDVRDSERITRAFTLYNSLFGFIRKTLNAEAGPITETILRNYYNEVRQREQALLHNVEFSAEGRLDLDLMELNLMAMDIPKKSKYVGDILIEILHSFLKAVRELLGETRLKSLEGDLRSLAEKHPL
ncbi:MAG: DUF4388 domain-containing protein [Acidobacteria bacterium]|nr:DUF4388 domain-containing protein [Acidobacteriota bacterium]